MNKFAEWQTKFNECLELEFSNPEYFKVHHILVPTYMLQTDQYSPKYRLGMIKLLQTFLIDPFNIPSHVLKEINAKFDSGKLEDNIKQKPGKIIETDFTILDVRLDSTENYYNDVLRWSNEVIAKIQ